MARAREVDLDCDQPFALAAARIVEVRSAELFEHSAGVLDLDEIERVHNMRVASRRLRAALEVFEPCFPPKPYRKALREVKALADSLGERRDPDVSIAALESFSSAVTVADRRGVSTLIEQLRLEQEIANEHLEPVVGEKHLSALAALLDTLVASARSRVGLQEGSSA